MSGGERRRIACAQPSRPLSTRTPYEHPTSVATHPRASLPKQLPDASRRPLFPPLQARTTRRRYLMNGAELLVSALENEGVEQVFGIPGEENLDIVEALRHSRIKLILTRHEQAAAFMAATHGRLTGRAGVCLTTLGPGALNLTTGAAYALLGAMPMVMITGQKGILSRKQARFQVVDIVATMAPLTKMARQIVSPTTIPSLVRDAFRVAQQERPGPVHHELPEDIAHEEVSDVALVPPHPIDIPVAHPAAL